MTTYDGLHHLPRSLVDRWATDLQSQPWERHDTDAFALEEAYAVMLLGEGYFGADLREVGHIGVITRIFASHSPIASLCTLESLHRELDFLSRRKDDLCRIDELSFVQKSMKCRCGGRCRCTACSEACLQREEVGTETLYSLPQTYRSLDLLVVGW